MGKSGTGGRSLHVFGALARGGAETWFLQALELCSDSGWTADVCLMADEEGVCAPRARALGLRVLHCPWRPAPTFPVRFLRLLRSERYDAVHAHVLLFSGAICALADYGGAAVRAAHAHNSSDGAGGGPSREIYRALMRRLIADHANLTLACSSAAAKALGASGPAILPYGIDLSRFERRPEPKLRAELGLPEAAPTLLAAGRLIEQKNYPFLIDAFSRALELEPDLHLLIAGEGEQRGPLEASITERGLSGRVRLLGLRDDVPALLLGACDGFVMPSLYEGLPVALLEAQAAGLPCLISERITSEAVIVGEQVEKLSLGEPWPEQLAGLASKPRLEPRAAVERLREAGLDAAGSWRAVTALYESTRSASWSAQAA